MASRLPPADEEAIATPPASSSNGLDEEPYDILDVALDAPTEIVEAAFKAQVRDLEGHPNIGGTSEKFQKTSKGRPDGHRVMAAGRNGNKIGAGLGADWIVHVAWGTRR